MSGVSRFAAPASCALACAMALAVQAGEVWVVAERSAKVHIVDTVSLATNSFALPFPSNAPPPSSLAFSTVDGAAGRYAFIGRGGALLVLDADTHAIMKTVDLESLTISGFQIADLASAPNRWVGAASPPVIETFLFVAGNAPRAADPDPEPYFAVVDQQALLDLKPAGSPIVVAHGPVHQDLFTPADRGRAVGVSTIASPDGAAHIRAFVAIRAVGTDESIRVARVSRGSGDAAPWSVDELFVRTLPQGAAAPAYFRAEAPYERELVVVPTGGGGSLVDIRTRGSCEVPFALGALTIKGPGVGGHQIDVIDATNARLIRINEQTCRYQSFPVGTEPVDVATYAGYRHGPSFVANRASDSVTVVATDETVTSVPLVSAHEGACLECPIRVRDRVGAGAACTQELTLSKLSSGAVQIDRSDFGCSGTTTHLLCQCSLPEPASCSCRCDPATNPECFGSLPLRNAPGQMAGTTGIFGPLAAGRVGNTGEPPRPYDPWIDLGFQPRDPDLFGDAQFITGTRPPPP